MLQKKVNWFKLYEGTLYKKSYIYPLLKCVTPEEGNYIIKEIHEGGCGIKEYELSLVRYLEADITGLP